MRNHCLLTTSHKTKVGTSHVPVYPRLSPCLGEKARIVAAGGFVDFGRVNGNLALSRAIGDFEFKKSADLSPEQQIVTAFPDVVTHEVTDDDEFLVIACDGMPLLHDLVFRCMANRSQAYGTANPPKPWWSSCEEALRQSKSCTSFART